MFSGMASSSKHVQTDTSEKTSYSMWFVLFTLSWKKNPNLSHTRAKKDLIRATFVCLNVALNMWSYFWYSPDVLQCNLSLRNRIAIHVTFTSLWINIRVNPVLVGVTRWILLGGQLRWKVRLSLRALLQKLNLRGHIVTRQRFKRIETKGRTGSKKNVAGREKIRALNKLKDSKHFNQLNRGPPCLCEPPKQTAKQ